MKEKCKGRKRKRLLSVVLAVAMVVTLMPMNSLKLYAANAYEITYNYSNGDQWTIPSAAKSAKAGDTFTIKNTTSSTGYNAILNIYWDGTLIVNETIRKGGRRVIKYRMDT